MKKIKFYWEQSFKEQKHPPLWWERKKALLRKRQAQIVHIKVYGKVYRTYRCHDIFTYEYFLHISFLIQDYCKRFSYEEMIIPYIVKNEEIEELHQKVTNTFNGRINPVGEEKLEGFFDDQTYNRLGAVRYAEYWWNSFNPIFSTWQPSSISFICQCIYAGFMEKHFFKHQLKRPMSEKQHVRFLEAMHMQEVSTATDLRLGDIVLYDFSGDNQWSFASIVTAKDSDKRPLVNAQFPSSRYRYWSFEDSEKWSTKTKYKFLRIH